MIYLRRVVGSSMEPTLKEGQIIVVTKARNFVAGDVVVAFINGREVIKRITKINNGSVFLTGDNLDNSTDSRTHGWITDRYISGKVIWPNMKKSSKNS